MSTIAERFLLVRGKMKQGEFARALQINPNTLRNYENGRVVPNQAVLARLCVYFSVSPEWLLLGNGHMRHEEYAHHTEPLQCISPCDLRATSSCRCVKLEEKIEKVEAQRDELAQENRQLLRENCNLRVENSEQKVQLTLLCRQGKMAVTA